MPAFQGMHVLCITLSRAVSIVHVLHVFHFRTGFLRARSGPVHRRHTALVLGQSRNATHQKGNDQSLVHRGPTSRFEKVTRMEEECFGEPYSATYLLNGGL